MKKEDFFDILPAMILTAMVTVMIYAYVTGGVIW